MQFTPLIPLLRPANIDKSNFIYFGEATLTGKKKKYTSLNSVYAVRSLSRELTHIAPYGRNIAYTRTFCKIARYRFRYATLRYATAVPR